MIPPYILPPFQVVVTNASERGIHPNPPTSILFTHTMTSKGTAAQSSNQNSRRRHFRARADGKTTTNDGGTVSMVRVRVVSKRRRV